jgi:hypothetical protein
MQRLAKARASVMAASGPVRVLEGVKELRFAGLSFISERGKAYALRPAATNEKNCTHE